MSEATTIVVKNREQTGTGPNRRLRAEGSVPAVVYGNNLPSVAITVEERTVQRLLREAGDNAVFMLQLEGGKQSRDAMIRDIHYEPHTGKLVHIDFMRVDMTVEVQVTVNIEIVGTPTGVTDEGGMMEMVMHDVEVSCLPNAIPEQLTVDVSELAIGDAADTSHLQLPDGVKLVDEEVRTLVTVNHPRVEEATTDDESALLEGESAEPEVVGKEDSEG